MNGQQFSTNAALSIDILTFTLKMFVSYIFVLVDLIIN